MTISTTVWKTETKRVERFQRGELRTTQYQHMLGELLAEAIYKRWRIANLYSGKYIYVVLWNAEKDNSDLPTTEGRTDGKS